MKLRWSNVPIPEAYVAGILVGAIVQLLIPPRIFPVAWAGHLLGWPLILLGIGFALWAVIASSQVDISSPDRLLTGGPYALSRNPMYVGWAGIHLGIACVANALWVLVALPLAAAYVHWVDIRKKERHLERTSGERYRQYKRRVRRYL